MFQHSVKVPRHYKVAANIIKKVSTEGGSVKSLLYDDKLRHFKTNVLYALISETIKHAALIDCIFDSCSILKNEPRLDPWLAKVLTAELLFGKKVLPGQSKPEQTISSYKEQFEKYTADNQDVLKTEVVRRPRYVRINTNLLSTSDAIRAFQEDGYRFVRCTSSSYNDYLKQIQNLDEYDFTQDFHIKTIFVFTSGTKLHEHYLYLENKIVLQDKATAMAVHLLAPPAGSVVLDLCAAPGMKTTQLAAFMRNEGKIYAVERNENRYKTLCDFVERTQSKCVETIHKDALEIKRGDFSDVEYILLDPSCSGSGMEFSVHNYIEDTRLAKLTSLQEKFLKHAMNAFPKAKRIVYSTCSVYPEENERVITNVVKTSRAKWRVQEVKELLKDQWNNFGSGMYGTMGAKCMYAKPESDFTTGFFLAVLDRDQKDLEKSVNSENKTEIYNLEDKTQNKAKVSVPENERDDHAVEEDMECNESSGIKKKKKKKDKKRKLEELLQSDQVEANESFEITENPEDSKKNDKYLCEAENSPIAKDQTENELNGTEKIKKKKRKKDKDDDLKCVNGGENETPENHTESSKKKKKKQKVTAEDQNISKELEVEGIQKKKKKKRDKYKNVTEIS